MLFSPTKPGKFFSIAFILICVVLFSVLTVYLQVMSLEKPFLYYLEQGLQIQRHTAVLDGSAPNPWQYRVLADYLVEGAIRLFQGIDIPHPVASAFVSFRFLQNLLIFGLAYLYYRKLKLSPAHALVGMCLLAWGMTYAYYDSDLQFNTYFDIIFYLLAGLLILVDKPIWIIPLMLLAALNRETSGLIPFMTLALILPRKAGSPNRKIIIIAAVSLAIFGVIFVGLRLIYPHQEISMPYGHAMGLDLLRYNLFRAVTWSQLFATLSIVPALALLAYKKWPPVLRIFFWVVIPAWFLIHPFTSVMAETRVFLVPQVLIFIPGALFLLKAGGQNGE
ncbi:MAG: hypothetical protein WA821_10520 [Anaerolineales bacterium]